MERGYAEVLLAPFSSSDIHSSFFNQSNYSDIRGTKGMETEGTYLFLDFSQSDRSNKIHQDNFSRSNYADLQIPFLRRHSASDRDTRATSTYADLDFSQTAARHRTDDTMDTVPGKRMSIHSIKPQTVYSKVRPYSCEELDQEGDEVFPKLYAKVLPKSQRKNQTGTMMKTSNSDFTRDTPLNENKPELKPISAPFKIRQITNLENIPHKNSKFGAPLRKPQIRNPPPILPKPFSTHNHAPPLPPHSKNIPFSPAGNHDNLMKLARKSMHNSDECLNSLEIIGSVPKLQRNFAGRSQSFRGPPRVVRPDKPPPPPPAKPTFHAFHPNNPILAPKSARVGFESSDVLQVSIPNIRTRSQGESSLFGISKLEPVTPPLPVRKNAKLPTQNNIKNTTLVTMETDRNSPVIKPNKLSAVTTFHKLMDLKPDLPPKPKPRLKTETLNIICEGKLWKRNPKTNEWSQWFAVLDMFTLKLYQSKDDQPWLTIPTIKIREINTFLLEGVNSQIGFGLTTTIKTYFFSATTNDQTKKWMKSITTTISCL